MPEFAQSQYTLCWDSGTCWKIPEQNVSMPEFVQSQYTLCWDSGTCWKIPEQNVSMPEFAQSQYTLCWDSGTCWKIPEQNVSMPEFAQSQYTPCWDSGTCRTPLAPLHLNHSSDCLKKRGLVCLLTGCLMCPSNMLVHHWDRSPQKSLRAATLRQKLQIKLSTSPSHSILALGQPVQTLTLWCQVPGRIATGVSISSR